MDDLSVRVFVPLARSDFELLQTLARTERRRPQDQAAHLLGQLLRSQLPLQSATQPSQSRQLVVA